MSGRTKLHAVRRNPRVRADDPEPSIDDLLDDPVLHLLMARDGVDRADLVQVIEVARLRLGVSRETPAIRFADVLFAECRA